MRSILAIVSAVVVISASFISAHATLRLRVEDMGVLPGFGAVITDQGPGDVNPAVGTVTFFGTLGGFTVSATGTSAAGQLTLSASGLVLGLNFPDSLRVVLEDTGYTTPADGPLFVNATLSSPVLPFGESATLQSWVNPLNLVPDLGADTTFGLLTALGAVPAGSVPACASPFTPSAAVSIANCSASWSKSGPYALFAQATFSENGGFSGSFFLNDAQRIGASAVPEPGSALLLGAAASGLVHAIRRQKKTARGEAESIKK